MEKIKEAESLLDQQEKLEEKEELIKLLQKIRVDQKADKEILKKEFEALEDKYNQNLILIAQQQQFIKQYQKSGGT